MNIENETNNKQFFVQVVTRIFFGKNEYNLIG